MQFLAAPFGRLEAKFPMSVTFHQLLTATATGRDWTCTNPMRLVLQRNGSGMYVGEEQVLDRSRRTAGTHGFLL